MTSLTIHVSNATDTAVLATTLAQLLTAGDIILFAGDLGTGKTNFVTSAGTTLGCQSRITSPTFIIADLHPIDLGTLIHVDAYRLGNTAEFTDLGLDEYMPQGITMIEWGDKIADQFTDYLYIEISFVEDGTADQRQFVLSSTTPAWQTKLEQLKANLPQEMFQS